MKQDTAEAGSTQEGSCEPLVQAMDIGTGQLVDLPPAEVVEIRAITGARPSGRDGWLWTPALARQLGFGRDPFREYPAVEDARLVQLVEMRRPGADDEVWEVDLLRADGVPQSLRLACLTDARDPIFDDMSVADRRQLTAPFLLAQAAA